jgi:hypothetical protein
MSGKIAWNKVRKLEAVSLNAIGLAGFGLGTISPILAGAVSLGALAKMALCGALCYILHKRATAHLAHLED